MSEFRGFIAIEIPINDKLQKLYDEINKISANIKLVELKNIHITLKFLGQTKIDDIDKIDEMIKDSIKNIKPFNIKIKGTGVFPNKNYIKVVWVGISQSKELKDIASSLNNQLSTLGYKKDKRSFSPHLTIGRMKSSKGKDELVSILKKYEECIFDEINVDTIYLKQSTLTPNGPIYEIIKEIKIE